MLEKICINCKNWYPDFGAILPSGPRKIIKGTYGKCRANYIDQTGIGQRYDMGTFGTMPCNAIDDQGELLFEAVPLG